jgi:hypothetical protein
MRIPGGTDTPAIPEAAASDPLVRCIPLEDPAAWREALSGIPHAFGHTWESCAALAASAAATPFLLTIRAESGRMVCALVEREFAGSRDVATPTGTSGFTGTGDCLQVPAAWDRFVTESEYVCGFIGLHPLFDAPAWSSGAESRNSLYFLDLTADLDEIVGRADRNRRRELRGRGGWAASLVHDRAALTEFLVREHAPFLQRVRARSTYALSTAALETLCSLENVLIVGAGDAEIDEVYVFTWTEHVADCFLNVVRPGARRHTTALVWAGIERLKALGVPILNLGGGLSENDAIARSKQRWGGRRLPLKALKQVYRPERYAELCRRSGAAPDGDFFPPYHRPGALGTSVPV